MNDACTCPTCGQPLPRNPAMALATKVKQLRDECSRQQITITWDGLVNEPAACLLMGYSRDTLRRQIEFGRNRIPFTRRGNRRLYGLEDLAREKLADFAENADFT